MLTFHQQKLTGDGWVQARVTDAGAAHEWTKVGVLLRESLDANARNVFIFDSGGHGLHTQWRSAPGGGTGQGEVKLAGRDPWWLRVERKGDACTLSASADGPAWTVCAKEPAIVAQTLKALDALCRKHLADPKLAGGEWDGKFGPASRALAVLALRAHPRPRPPARCPPISSPGENSPRP